MSTSREATVGARGRWRAAIAAAAALALIGGALAAAQRRVPSPATTLGFEPCADYHLATYEQTAGYFQRLAAAMPSRIRLVEMGRTVEGRTQLMAIISSEQNLQQIDRYKRIARALAMARGADRQPLDDAQARALAADGRTVVWIDFGLHSNEVAPAQSAPLLAFDVVGDESAEMQAIRDNVVLLLVPNMNPDGTTMVADWYNANRGKPWENRLPELYHRYVGHDDNRDWFMMTQPETRNSARQLYEAWFPQIVYNQHQSGPFPSRIFVPPFDDPMNPNIPPLVARGVNAVGDAITQRLDEEGKRGAISRIGFDMWWNGGMRTAPYFHNMIGILTETSHASATPATYDPRTFPKAFANGVSTTEPSIAYPSPYPGGEWHLRNSCDYIVTASMAVLSIAAKRRQEFLYDTYQMARDAQHRGAAETFVVPSAQWDPGTAVKMVNVLRLGGVDVERADGPFAAGGHEYAAGSFVIRGAQPFEPYVRDLLTPQAYPDMRLYPGGPPKRPYDITGWTLPYQMGVTVDRIAEAVQAGTSPVDVAAAPQASVAARAHVFAIDPRANDAFTLVNRLLAAGAMVLRAPSAIDAGGVQWPAGAFLVVPTAGTAERIGESARALGLTVAALDRLPADAVPVRAPRIGLYHAWGGNIDEGWTRWVLEQFAFPYATLHDADIRTGHLAATVDVIVLPSATYDRMLNGVAAGQLPPEMTGGMTAAGVANLRAFVEDGGTLVAMNRAAELPIAAFHLPVRDVLAGVAETAFYGPGTIVRLDLDPSAPIAYGMPPEAAAFFADSSAFAVERGDADRADPPPAGEVRVAGKYAARNILMSGWMLGPERLAGRAAVVDARLGRGHVVLLGFSAQHRGQSHGTFKLLFNSLYFFGDAGRG